LMRFKAGFTQTPKKVTGEKNDNRHIACGHTRNNKNIRDDEKPSTGWGAGKERGVSPKRSANFRDAASTTLN